MLKYMFFLYLTCGIEIYVEIEPSAKRLCIAFQSAFFLTCIFANLIKVVLKQYTNTMGICIKRTCAADICEFLPMAVDLRFYPFQTGFCKGYEIESRLQQFR